MCTTKLPLVRSQSEIIRPTNENNLQATINFLPGSTHVIYKTLPSKLWYPAIITNIMHHSQSYIKTTPYGATCRCTRFHLKPYKLPTNQGTEVAIQTPFSNSTQDHTKQVSTHTDLCLRQLHRSIRAPAKMDV